MRKLLDSRDSRELRENVYYIKSRLDGMKDLVDAVDGEREDWMDTLDISISRLQSLLDGAESLDIDAAEECSTWEDMMNYKYSIGFDGLQKVINSAVELFKEWYFENSQAADESIFGGAWIGAEELENDLEDYYFEIAQAMESAFESAQEELAEYED